jgi:hypothetical protein
VRTDPDLDGDFARRIRVVLARQRIEEAALRLVQAAERPPVPGRRHGHVTARLLLLLHGADSPDRFAERLHLADRAAAVYAGTSDVLHSRRTYVDVPEALLREWEDVVDALESAVDGG